MDLKRARDTIENVFSNEFDRETFIKFASNLLNSNFSQPSILQGNQIPEQFKDGISSLEILSNYVDSSQKKIDLLIVTLKKDTALDRRRTMQRNFVARYLDNKLRDAALVAFVTPRKDNWRFSLIQIESRLEGVKVIDEYTPAKRWSFLLGENEGCHTAKSQLLGILASDNENPTLDDLIEAFNIETVTKEFYKKYRELFDRMTKDLEELIAEDQDIREDFENKEIDPRDFARKTMGQISFLYFLQKKGWFGVQPGDEWGTGDRDFVRKLFQEKATDNNFFNDVLEPLFYEALALDRGENAIYPALNIRMPFLNGGLFEPLNGYSWKTTDITLPDELFTNNNLTNEGDSGSGILDIFDRYNFTVNESEPLEMEVAVDPEMLGKVFENLIDENIRKGNGTYYTPRPIVHYMCQESLINYLDTELSFLVPKEEIESFIRDESEQFELSDALIIQAQKIDDLLANIKVCDPAVGSGAFPLGLLNQIVKSREKIGKFINSNLSNYDLKLHAISNSLYGVDLDPGAIEIAKLRFWLSLVVEEDTPSPLPNLEHKIMQGNSLISEYEGIRLFDDNLLAKKESIQAKIDEIDSIINAKQKKHIFLHSKGEYTNINKSQLEQVIKPLLTKKKRLQSQIIQKVESSDLFDNENSNEKIAQNLFIALQEKVAEHFSTHSQSKKERLKGEIEETKWRLIEITLLIKGEHDRLNEIQNLRRQRIKPFFIWKLEFGDVFKNNGGFDIIIANPPYIEHDKIDQNTKNILKNNYSAYAPFADIYCYFVELGLLLLKESGINCFITSNSFLKAQYGKNLRDYIVSCADNLSMINVEDSQLFESAIVNTVISVSKKEKLEDRSCTIVNKNFDKNLSFIDFINCHKYLYKQSDFIADSWTLVPRDLLQLASKIENNRKTLNDLKVKIRLGIATGANYAFILDKAQKDNLINLDNNNANLIKPILRGRDIDRYYYKNSNKYVLLTKNGVNVKNDYPSLYQYFKGFGKKFEERGAQGQHWTNLRACAFFDDFMLEKIIWIELTDKGRFALCNDEKYLVNSAYFLLPPADYSASFLLGILNSRVVQCYLSIIAGTSGMGTLRWINYYVEKIPIPQMIDRQKTYNDIENLVKQIISSKELNSNEETLFLEQEIDQLVYDLYDLTEEEIEIVQENTS